MAMLPSDERSAAERLNNSEAKARFLQCRTILRMLLGEAIGEGYCAEPFQYGPDGKPALCTEYSLQFNLAHSGELAVFAVAEWKSNRAHVGVDVERTRQRPGAMAIARRFFHPKEIAYLTSIAIEEQESEFLRMWVRKEACLKAIGAGIEGTLAGFSVHNAMEPVSLEDNSAVWLYDLPIGMHAAAALACTQPLEALSVGPLLPAATWLHQLHALS
jgi:4'-phosphopantetheinyl transferase